MGTGEFNYLITCWGGGTQQDIWTRRSLESATTYKIDWNLAQHNSLFELRTEANESLPGSNGKQSFIIWQVWLYTWRDAASLLSSCTTDASASGFTPASHNFTQIAKDSGSRPVLSNLDISTNAEKM